MTCPDWTALTAHRKVRDGVEPAEWAAARAHAGACPACRRAAVAADPTLLFQRLGEAEAAPLPSEEIAAMQQAVSTLRRARATAVASTPLGRHRRLGWRVAAAAALPLCALLLHGAPRPQALDHPIASVAPRALVASGVAAPSAELVALPLVDDLDNPAARVYELGSTDLAVVMIVDETLDV